MGYLLHGSVWVAGERGTFSVHPAHFKRFPAIQTHHFCLRSQRISDPLGTAKNLDFTPDLI